MKVYEYFNETQTTIERDLTEAELAQREADIAKDKADLLAREAEAEARAQAKAAAQAKLAALGLTVEDLQALGL
jgi:hypothetical protein